MPKKKRTKPLSRTAKFNVESRLLEELGERLVSNAQVAIVELIKNAYDADATECTVEWNEEQIVISDDGHGMTEDAFRNLWMTVATSDKTDRIFSPRYSRKMTGEKGVGRFAARFLGRHLTLNTVAKTGNRAQRSRLIGVFDWTALDKKADLRSLTVPYTLESSVADKPGTTLTIKGLRRGPDPHALKAVRTNVLGLASPFAGLDGASKARSARKRRGPRKLADPGFTVKIGDTDANEAESNLASLVLDNYVASAQLRIRGSRLSVKVHFNAADREFSEKCAFKNAIGSDVTADIRYFPRRAGTFANADVDGRRAWSWVRDYSGVAVIDHGFRVPPYGAGEDDWLSLDADTVSRRRDWRSSIMQRRHAIPDHIRQQPKLNPALWLPRNLTVVGAVFVESSTSDSDKNSGLIPSMDRQGFLENQAFLDLREAVRFSLELIGHFDTQLAREEEERTARRNRKKARQEIRVAMDEIRSAPNLSKELKNTIINQYADLYDHVDEIEQYDQSIRQNLDVMSSLGVIAGFMTHEVQRMLYELRQALKILAPIAKKEPKVAKAVAGLTKSERSFQSYSEFTKLFLGDGIHIPKQPYKAKYRIKNVVDTFKDFQSDRNIDVELEIEDRVIAPRIPLAMYSGIALNLHTNAMKAVIQNSGKQKKCISYRAWNDEKNHYLEVLDTGVGIPEKIRDRVFDPLYTTTSSLDSPLGSGMGLGLAMTKQLVESAGGQIKIVDAPNGYSTCFQVRLPLARK